MDRECEHGGKIERQVLGGLAPDELAELRAHIRECPSCAARFEEASYLETLLVGAFRDAERSLHSPREAVLGAIEAGIARAPAPGRASGRTQAPGRHPLARRVAWFALGNAIAAALLVSASLGYSYVALLREKRAALAVQAKVEVRNLAIVLRARKAAAKPEKPDLEGALASLGIARDPFGNAFVLEPSRLYSLGANGRDERGAGDDIVAFLE